MDGNRFKLNLKLWMDRRASLLSQWNDSIWAFLGEKKVGTKELAEKIVEAENSIASLQTFQSQFNLQIAFEWQGKTISLMQAIKMIGGAGRLEKMWSSASKIKKDQYGYGLPTKKSDEETVTRTISIEDAAKLSSKYTRDAGRLRALIAKGNQRTHPMDIPAGLLLDEK